MPNDFYTPTGNPPDGGLIVSADMRAEFAAILAGFNKMPALTGNANKLVVINSSGTGMDVTTAPAGLTSINKVAITQPANGATLTILDGKTLTANHSLTLAGTDSTVMTFPATSASVARIDAAQTFVGTQTFSGLINANLGLTVAGAAFNSRGITDNATAKALTLSGSGANSITIANSATNPTIGTSAGAVSFNPAGQGETLRVTTGGASTVNYFSLSGATTGGRLTLLATGSDTNVGASWQTKGSGSHLFVTETGASAQVEITHTASADRYITLTGSAGGNPTIGTSAGALKLQAAGVDGLLINPNATADTYVQLTLPATGNNYAALLAQGSGANVGMFIGAKGTGAVGLYTSGLTNLQVAVTHTASADRYITLTGANTANPKISTSAGSLDVGAPVVFTGQTVGTTVGAAGGASALPATPLGYLTTNINGSACKIPYYN